MPNLRDKSKGCPNCGKPTSNDHAPFCSRGCKDRDLLRWLDESYRIPGPSVDPTGVDSGEHGG